MKKFCVFFLLLQLIHGKGLYGEGNGTYAMDALLKTYVHEGMVNNIRLNLVDYTAWKTDKKYSDVLDQIETTDSTLLDGDEAKAFWINAYNVLAIKMVLDHYPVDSIKDARSFFSPVWDKKVFEIRGKPITLGDIEHTILRPMGDPRIHFAIVCASVSCPDLRTGIYTAEQLDVQLDEQTKKFLTNTKKGFQRDKDSIRVSSIFKWYKEDFEVQGGVKEFLKKYVSEADRAKIDDNTTINYLPYDWSLNDILRDEKIVE